MMYWSAIAERVVAIEQLMFADETSLDGRTMRRKRGWGPRGQRVQIIEMYHRGRRISILALFGIAGFIDARFVYGAFDAANFMEAMVDLVEAYMLPCPQRRSLLVLDNCNIHHMYELDLVDLIRRKGGRLLYLAPYSPIDNPIESAFNVFKAYWKRHGAELNEMPAFQAITTALLWCYADPSTGAQKCFADSGYVD